MIRLLLVGLVLGAFAGYLDGAPVSILDVGAIAAVLLLLALAVAASVGALP